MEKLKLNRLHFPSAHPASTHSALAYLGPESRKKLKESHSRDSVLLSVRKGPPLLTTSKEMMKPFRLDDGWRENQLY